MTLDLDFTRSAFPDVLKVDLVPMFGGHTHSVRAKCQRTFLRPLSELLAMWIGEFFGDHESCQMTELMRQRILQLVLIVDDLFG